MNAFLFYFYLKTMYILQTRLYTQEINLKKLHKFSNTTFYIKHIKETLCLKFFLRHPMVTGNYVCMISWSHISYLSSCLNLIITKYEFNAWSQSHLTKLSQVFRHMLPLHIKQTKPKKHSRDLMFCPNLSMLQHFL